MCSVWSHAAPKRCSSVLLAQANAPLVQMTSCPARFHRPEPFPTTTRRLVRAREESRPLELARAPRGVPRHHPSLRSFSRPLRSVPAPVLGVCCSTNSARQRPTGGDGCAGRYDGVVWIERTRCGCHNILLTKFGVLQGGGAEMAPKIVAVRKTCGHKLRTVKRETISPPSPGLLPSGSTRAKDLLGENSKSHRAHRTRQFCFFVLPSTRSAQITRNHSTHSCRPIQTERVGGQVRACKLPSAPMQTRERSVRVLAPGAPGKRGLSTIGLQI